MLDPKGDAASIIRYFESYTGTIVDSGLPDGISNNEDTSLLELADKAIAFTVLAATCEAAAVGLGSGIKPEVQLELLNAGTACSYWSENVVAPQVMSRCFESGITIEDACEVLKEYLAYAKRSGLPDGLVTCVLEVWENTGNELGTDRDITELIRRYEKLVGVEFSGTA